MSFLFFTDRNVEGGLVQTVRRCHSRFWLPAVEPLCVVEWDHYELYIGACEVLTVHGTCMSLILPLSYSPNAMYP